MRIETRQSLAYTTEQLTFTKTERATLDKARQILDTARDLARAHVDYDADGEAWDTSLAMGYISIEDVLDGVELSCQPGGLLLGAT